MKQLREGHWPIFLLSSLSSVANLFLPLVLVRLLTPEEIGSYKVFFVYLSILPFLVMAGGPLHSVYYWAGFPGPERKKYLNATWTLTLGLSALIALFGLPIDAYLASHFHVTPLFMVFLILAGFLWSPTSHFSEASIALGRRSVGALFDTGFELFKVAAFILIALKFRSLEKVFIFFVVMLAVKLLLAAYLNKRLNGIQLQFDPAAMKKVMAYSGPIALTGCLGVFIEKFDLILLSGYMDSRSFAFYSMGCLAVPPLFLLEMSVQKILIPSLSARAIANEWAAAAADYRKAIADISFLILPSVFGLFVFADAIVELLFTAAYAESAVYLRLFSLSYLLLMLPHDSVARATGRTTWILKTYLVITPLSLAVTFIAVQHLTAVSVLACTVAIKFVPKLLGLWFSAQGMHWRMRDMFPWRILLERVIVCALLSALSLLLRASFTSPVQWFLVCGSVFAAVYLGLSYLRKKP